MVHLIVMPHASASDIAKVETILTNHGGWYRVQQKVWLVATDVMAADWRTFLNANVPGPSIVVRVMEDWAVQDMRSLAEWLQGANGWF